MKSQQTLVRQAKMSELVMLVVVTGLISYKDPDTM
jgi:hypothetical protein